MECCNVRDLSKRKDPESYPTNKAAEDGYAWNSCYSGRTDAFDYRANNFSGQGYVIMPQKPTNVIESSYLSDMLLGFTRGDWTVFVNKNYPNKKYVIQHEERHCRFNHEPNTPEHEDMTRLRDNMGVYPKAIYAFPVNHDYRKIIDFPANDLRASRKPKYTGLLDELERAA
ncbi:MAG: hypothetical protein HZB65_00325 [Candidatus Aenigmarchaeota archaeon]|nr:hypothetical protein [Candidatus Aenigmarchaeota archaeon]